MVRRRSVVAMDQNDVVDLAIDIRSLVKTFGSTRALDGLDLQVRRGEVHGFLGPNGSGKTTTLRVLLGLLRADSGSVRLLDGDPWRDAAALHRRLAYVPGDVTLWPNLTGGEVIDLLGRMRGGLDERRRATLLERFELDPTKKSRSYSKGNRQKVALVAALSSDVELLLLDEPTSGLDPLMEAMFRRCIDEERGQGRTVLLSSHILAEAEVRQHRAARPDRRDRHHGRAAAPDPYVRDRRAGRRPRRPHGTLRHSWPRGEPDPVGGHPGSLSGGLRPAGGHDPGLERSRDQVTHQPAPHPRGAVPAALQRPDP
jgi:ABC-type Na+ transport system ATPase subunit NatA